MSAGTEWGYIGRFTDSGEVNDYGERLTEAEARKFAAEQNAYEDEEYGPESDSEQKHLHCTYKVRHRPIPEWIEED